MLPVHLYETPCCALQLTGVQGILNVTQPGARTSTYAVFSAFNATSAPSSNLTVISTPETGNETLVQIVAGESLESIESLIAAFGPISPSVFYRRCA